MQFDSTDAIVPETCKFAFDVLVIDMHRSKGDGHAVLFQRDCPVVGGNHLVWTRGGCMDEAFVNTAIFHSYGQVVPCAREFWCYSVMARKLPQDLVGDFGMQSVCMDIDF